MGELTRTELADMIDDESIIGKCVEFIYADGPNSKYPLYMEFTGYSDPFGYNSEHVNYNLTNPNTEKYVETQGFTFNKAEFITNLLQGENRLESMTIVDNSKEPEWTL